MASSRWGTPTGSSVTSRSPRVAVGNGAGLGTARGYGTVWSPLRQAGALAHRHAWELTHGAIPDGLHVCHTCDHRPCVRPDHLFLGTPSDNLRDMSRKSRRSWQGEANPAVKLSDAQVVDIRQQYRRGGGMALAAQYGVSPGTVYNIVNGRSGRYLLDARKAA